MIIPKDTSRDSSYMNGWFSRKLRALRVGKVLQYIPDNAEVCDIGCGIHLDLFQHLPTLKKGYGIDLTLPSGKRSETIEIINTDVENGLPLPDESVDVVAMLACLEHITNDQELLRESYRILRPGGVIVVTVPTIWNKPIGEFLAYRLHVIEESEYRDHKRYYTKTKLTKDLTTAGFSSVKTGYWEFAMNTFGYGKKN